jgi:pimeloyl-ACP methyl ester carboxylesterase
MATKKTEKPLVLLIHGLRGSHHGLAEVARGLETDFEVLTPDLPGSGEETELEDKTLDGYAEWLHEYCGRCARKPFVIGHSMGSIVVSHFVAKYPDDVEKRVVLISPILRTKGGERSGRALHYALRGVLAPFPPKVKREIMASKPVSYAISHYLTYDKTKQKQIDELHYKYGGQFASAASLLADAKISMMRTTVVPEDKKVLLVMGRYDKLTKAKLVEELARKDGVEYRELADVGHLLNYEKPEEVAGVIKEFLT